MNLAAVTGLSMSGAPILRDTFQATFPQSLNAAASASCLFRVAAWPREPRHSPLRRVALPAPQVPTPRRWPAASTAFSPLSNSRSCLPAIPTCLSLARTLPALRAPASPAPPASPSPSPSFYLDSPSSRRSFRPRENPDDSCARARRSPADSAPACEIHSVSYKLTMRRTLAVTLPSQHDLPLAAIVPILTESVAQARRRNSAKSKQREPIR